MKMREIAEGIYEVILHDKEKEVGEMRVHIVKGKPGKRSLMVDTGFGSQGAVRSNARSGVVNPAGHDGLQAAGLFR